MAASDPVRARRVAVCVALIGAVAVADCGGGEYVHSNPFDPVVPVTLRIEGPDKTVAQFDTVRFKVVTDPVYDYGSAVWSATGGLEKSPIGQPRRWRKGTPLRSAFVLSTLDELRRTDSR